MHTIRELSGIRVQSFLPTHAGDNYQLLVSHEFWTASRCSSHKPGTWYRGGSWWTYLRRGEFGQLFRLGLCVGVSPVREQLQQPEVRLVRRASQLSERGANDETGDMKDECCAVVLCA